MLAGHPRDDVGLDHHDADHDNRLARAAAALAQAEGLTGVRPPPRKEPPPGPLPSPLPGSAAGSSPGAALDRAEVAPEADPESVARAIVLRQLSLAPRSRAQLETKLRQRGCADDVAARVLDRMTEVGLVDDEAYAELLVRSKHSGKGLARRALAHELRRTGIDQDIAAEALEQVAAEDERAAAEALVAKRMRSMHGLAPDVQARRLAGLLARKGYSGGLAWPVIRDAIEAAAEHQRD